MLSKVSPINTLRGGLRKFGYARGRSSYPFISGDTYASLCDYKYSGDLRPVEKELQMSAPNNFKLFLPAHLTSEFLQDLQNFSIDFSNSKLIVHNYDNIPTSCEMEKISQRFREVLSVNWLGDPKIAKSIPIGLENWGHLRNGVPRDFSKMIENGIPTFEKREITLLSSFSISTNVIERKKAFDFLSNYPETLQMEEFTSPRDYRKLLLNSKFVISPPGNGPDCHRTWEALYLGAVPVVLEKYWPFSSYDLPVILVKNWAEIPESISNYKEQKPASVEFLRRMFLDIFTSD